MNRSFGFLSVVTLVGTTSLFACSINASDDDDSGESPRGNAPTSSSSGAATSSSGGGVNLATQCAGALATGAIVGAELLPADAAPLPAGGTIADGTYQLVRARVFGAAAAGHPEYSQLKLKETIEVSAGTWRRAYALSGAGTSAVGSDSGTFTTASNVVGGEEKCDDGDGADGVGGFLHPYTWSSESLTLFDDEGGNVVFTYDKQ
jgi:hypothetical protein